MEQEVFIVWYHDNYANDFYKRFTIHAEAELAAEKYNRNEEGHACVITEDDYESMIERLIKPKQPGRAVRGGCPTHADDGRTERRSNDENRRDSPGRSGDIENCL